MRLAAVRQQVTQSAVAHVMGFDLQVLHHEVFVAVLLRVPSGNSVQSPREWSHESSNSSGLVPLGRPGPFAAVASSYATDRGAGHSKCSVGSSVAWRQPFQPVDLLAQCPNLCLLLFDHPQQDNRQEAFVPRRAPRCQPICDRPGSIHAQQENTKIYPLQVKTNFTGLLRAYLRD